MEVLLYLFVALLGIAILFMLIEYPYYLVGVLVFIVFYNYNIDLPGPLDTRGLLTLTLLLRLIVFDKSNLNVIVKVLLRNANFLLILLFVIYFIVTTSYNVGSYKTITRVMLFKLIGLLLGFIAVYNGHEKKVFFGAILAAGIISVADLVNHYLTGSGFHITRILDKAFKSKYSTDWNHNAFGLFIGVAFVVVYVFSFTKQIKILTALVLLSTLGVGIVLSTSRGTMLGVFLAIIIGTLIFPKEKINIKKIFSFALVMFLLSIFIAIASIFLFKSFGLKAEFADKLYYRLAEEPLSIISGNDNKFTLSGKKEVGTIEWRIKQAERDMHEYGKLSLSKQLFGLGHSGYFQISKKKWYGKAQQLVKYTSHNGYVLLLIERGIIGFVLFVIFYLSLIFISARSFRNDISSFPFYIILIFFLVFTYGAQDQLLDRFSYFMFGGIIGQYINSKFLFEEDDIEDEEVLYNNT